MESAEVGRKNIEVFAKSGIVAKAAQAVVEADVCRKGICRAVMAKTFRGVVGKLEKVKKKGRRDQG
jgi:hypothetical protein